MPALLGGLFLGVLSALPIVNCCCCLWIAGGGFLSAYLEAQRHPTSLSILQGARVGLFAGIIGAVVWLLISSALSPLNVRFLELASNAPDMPARLARSRNNAESSTMGAARMLSRQRKLILSCIG